MTARHPWYYVSGRKDLTEKRIATRRERDAQHARQADSDHKYFSRWDAESELRDHWRHNKTLVKRADRVGPTEPPYDVIETRRTARPLDPLSERRVKESEKKCNEWRRTVSAQMMAMNKVILAYKKLQIRQNLASKLLHELLETRELLREKREFWQLREKRLFYVRFGRDKLRQRVFLICDQLNYYKIIVASLSVIQNCEQIFTEPELTQMSDVNDGAVKILDMYLQINQNRNNEFHGLYHEEGEQRWSVQKLEWEQESLVFNALMDKLLDTYYAILKEKISDVLSEQKTSLTEREQVIKELSSLSNKFKRDPMLRKLLSENVWDYRLR